MRHVVLGALFRNGPHARIGVDLAPRHFGDLAEPLAGQQEKLADMPEGMPELAASCPEQL
jgi:hypothetical protein